MSIVWATGGVPTGWVPGTHTVCARARTKNENHWHQAESLASIGIDHTNRATRDGGASLRFRGVWHPPRVSRRGPDYQILRSTCSRERRPLHAAERSVPGASSALISGGLGPQLESICSFEWVRPALDERLAPADNRTVLAGHSAPNMSVRACVNRRHCCQTIVSLRVCVSALLSAAVPLLVVHLQQRVQRGFCNRVCTCVQSGIVFEFPCVIRSPECLVPFVNRVPGWNSTWLHRRRSDHTHEHERQRTTIARPLGPRIRDHAAQVLLGHLPTAVRSRSRPQSGPARGAAAAATTAALSYRDDRHGYSDL